MKQNYWNYRILKYKNNELGIHEVYYTDGKPDSCTTRAVGVYGNDLEDIKGAFELMKLALNKPILNYDDFK